MDITYLKRNKGGYYATVAGENFFCTVERRYIFTIPDKGWDAWYKGTRVYGDTRKEAVEILFRKIMNKKGN
jgi:hypothetical protein